MAPPDDIGTAELARQVRDVFSRIEGIAQRLEGGQFVRTDIFNLYKEAVDARFAALMAQVLLLQSGKADDVVVKNQDVRLSQLEDDKKWLIRVVLTFVVLGVLGAVFAASKVG